jgi:collagenase-like PrtC family protease
MVFIAMLEKSPEFFREGVEIGSVFGVFPPSLWNGGRVMHGTCDKQFVKGIIKYFNDKKIPMRFTFTNPVLEKKHMSDNFCNTVMHLADNGINGCIVVSPVLEKYIRENFPGYKLTSSTCKRITDSDTLAEELEKDYDLVVLDYDFNNRFDVLEKLSHKEKVEILVNPCCNPGCSRRTEHYRVIGLEQIEYAEHLRKHPNIPYDPDKFAASHPENKTELGCRCELRSLSDIKKLQTHITPDDIWNKYVPMGYSNFKIEGRTFDIFNLMEHYLYYMVKPECVDTARLVFLRNLRRNGVITVNE